MITGSQVQKKTQGSKYGLMQNGGFRQVIIQCCVASLFFLMALMWLSDYVGYPGNDRLLMQYFAYSISGNNSKKYIACLDRRFTYAYKDGNGRQSTTGYDDEKIFAKQLLKRSCGEFLITDIVQVDNNKWEVKYSVHRRVYLYGKICEISYSYKGQMTIETSMSPLFQPKIKRIEERMELNSSEIGWGLFKIINNTKITGKEYSDIDINDERYSDQIMYILSQRKADVKTKGKITAIEKLDFTNILSNDVVVYRLRLNSKIDSYASFFDASNRPIKNLEDAD